MRRGRGVKVDTQSKDPVGPHYGDDGSQRNAESSLIQPHEWRAAISGGGGRPWRLPYVDSVRAPLEHTLAPTRPVRRSARHAQMRRTAGETVWNRRKQLGKPEP